MHWATYKISAHSLTSRLVHRLTLSGGETIFIENRIFRKSNNLIRFSIMKYNDLNIKTLRNFWKIRFANYEVHCSYLARPIVQFHLSNTVMTEVGYLKVTRCSLKGFVQFDYHDAQKQNFNTEYRQAEKPTKGRKLLRKLQNCHQLKLNLRNLINAKLQRN